jgi:hypothetical protein
MSAPTQLVVCTDDRFRELIRTRSKRIGREGIEFVYCELPSEMQRQLDGVLDVASAEQRTRAS